MSQRERREIRRICVYAASSQRLDPVYHDAARALAERIAARGMELVFGGGRTGLMGAVADAALAAGARVVGVIPEKLSTVELAHQGCDEMIVVESMHQRKLIMARLSQAAVALPGGFGTLEELSETLTWTQLRFHDIPVGVLNVEGYYDPLLAWVERAVERRFVRQAHAGLLQVDTDPDALLDKLVAAEVPPLEGWI